MTCVIIKRDGYKVTELCSLVRVALAQTGFGTEHRFLILKPSISSDKITVFDLEGVNTNSN